MTTLTLTRKSGATVTFEPTGAKVKVTTTWPGGGTAVATVPTVLARRVWATEVKGGAKPTSKTSAETLDLAAFDAKVVAALGHVGLAALEPAHRWDAKVLGAAFISKAEFAARPSRWVIEVNTKTHRTASGWDDYCGTAKPSGEAMKAAEALAAEYGLSVKWEPCEKGWGSFWFEDAK